MTKVAATVAAVNSALAALVLVGIVSLTADQLAGIGIAVNALMLAVAAWLDPRVPFGPAPSA